MRRRIPRHRLAGQVSLTTRVEEYRCPLSTDGGGRESRHYINNGACVICDMTLRRLAYLHGIYA